MIYQAFTHTGPVDRPAFWTPPSLAYWAAPDQFGPSVGQCVRMRRVDILPKEGDPRQAEAKVKDS